MAYQDWKAKYSLATLVSLGSCQWLVAATAILVALDVIGTEYYLPPVAIGGVVVVYGYVYTYE